MSGGATPPFGHPGSADDVATGTGGTSVTTDTILARAQFLLPSAGFDTVLGYDFDSNTWHDHSNFNGGADDLLRNVAGGVLRLNSPVSGAICQIFPKGSPSFIGNAQTQPWYFIGIFNIPQGADANAICCCGPCAIDVTPSHLPTNPAFRLGVSGDISSTNFCYRLANGAGVVKASGVGPVLDTNKHGMEILNTTTNVNFYFDQGPTGTATIGSTPSTNIDPVPMMVNGAALSGATNVSRSIDIDALFLVCKR